MYVCACVICSIVEMALAVVLSLCVAVGVAVGSDTECGASGWQVPSRPAGLTLRQVNTIIRYVCQSTCSMACNTCACM